jgi:hypothetical protein
MSTDSFSDEPPLQQSPMMANHSLLIANVRHKRVLLIYIINQWLIDDKALLDS